MSGRWKTKLGKQKPKLDSGRRSVHRRSPWVLGSAGAAKPFRGHTGRLGPARVRRQGRTAKALARPAGEAEDTGAAATLDGRSARRGQASRAQRGAQVADTATGVIRSRGSAGIGRWPGARAQRACEWAIQKGPKPPFATSAHARPSSRCRGRRRSDDPAPAHPRETARS